MHWSELIGGDLSMTLPYEWQAHFNASDIEVIERMHNPVDPRMVETMYRLIPDFRRAYDPDGLSMDEFDDVWRHGAHAAHLHWLVP